MKIKYIFMVFMVIGLEMYKYREVWRERLLLILVLWFMLIKKGK